MLGDRSAPSLRRWLLVINTESPATYLLEIFKSNDSPLVNSVTIESQIIYLPFLYLIFAPAGHLIQKRQPVNTFSSHY